MDVAPLHNTPQTVAPAPVSADGEQQAQNLQLIQAVHAVNAAELYGEESELAFWLDRRTRHDSTGRSQIQAGDS